MNKKIMKQARQYQKRRRGYKLWKRIVSVLGAIVVFITTYMLILPAITLEPAIICGIEEHEHDLSCYESLPAEESSAQLICSPTHVHSDECLSHEGVLICGVSDVTVHSHGEFCYYGGELICTLPELEAHLHSQQCYHEETIGICGLEADPGEHIHDGGCFVTESTLVCELPEAVLHLHTDECYVGKCLTADCTHEENCELVTTLVCAQPVLEEHCHTQDCLAVSVSTQQKQTLICEKEEHVHVESCLEYPVEGADSGISHKDVEAWAELTEQPSLFMRKSARTTSATPRIGDALDMTEWINGVAMYKTIGEDQVLIESGSTVTKGDLIEFKIEYTVPGQKLATLVDEELNVISDTVVYKLPEAFRLVNYDSGSIYNAANQTVGSYEIDDASKTVVMIFEESYLKQNAGGMQIHGYISFFSTIEKLTDEESEDQQFVFKDKINLDLVVCESEPEFGDLIVEKEKTEINGNVIEYTVSVRSDEGTFAPIVLSDLMTGGLGYLSGSMSVTDGNGDPVSFTEPADRSDTIEITLAQLQAGGEYTLVYRAALEKEYAAAEVTVKNTVTVASENNLGQPLSDSCEIPHTFTLLEKEGVQGAQGQVEWTVTVNRSEWDISGWILRDTVNGSEYVGSVTIMDGDGNVINASLPYVFPEGSDDCYTVTYTTTHQITEGYTVSNRVSLEDNIVCEASASVGPPVTKTGSVIGVSGESDESRRTYVRWTVTIDASNTEIPAGAYIYDKLDGNSASDGEEADHYLTLGQLTDALDSLISAIESAGGGIARWEAAEYRPGIADYGSWISSEDVGSDPDRLYERFRVVLSEAIPAGRTLSFSYETTGTLPNGASEGTVYKNRINIADAFEISAKALYFSGTLDVEKHAMVYKPEYDGNEPDWNEEYGDVTEIDYNDLHNGYLAWQIDLRIPADYSGSGDITIYEDLPDTLSVAGIASRSTGYLPLWEEYPDSEDGKIEWWIYPDAASYDLPDAASYDLPEDQRPSGTTASVYAKLTESGDIVFTVDEAILKLHADFAKYYGVDEMKMYLFIYTEINDGLQWNRSQDDPEGKLSYFNSFENSFTAADSDGNTFDAGTQTQIVRKDESDETVIKSGSVEDNVVNYTVVINQYGRDLIPDSDKLETVDVLSYRSTADKYLRAKLVPASVKLYRFEGFDASEAPVKGEELEFAYLYNEEKQVFLPPENGYDTETTLRTHTIGMNLPDAEPLILEYSYSIDADKDSHTLVNECLVKGAGQTAIDGNTTIDVIVKDATARADIDGAIICKLDLLNNGKYLEGARFNLFVWNGDEGRYIKLVDPDTGGEDFVTDENGMIILDSETIGEVAYNTAYYIVETKAPDGYFLDPEPCYFYIQNSDTEKYPLALPDGFNGTAIENGDIIYRHNEENSTQITLKKLWQDHNGNEKTVTSVIRESITVDLWQQIEDEPKLKKLWGSYTVVPDENGNWSLTVDDLPKATLNGDMTKGKEYIYYIEEDTLPGYIVIYKNNDGIKSGTITLINREQKGYDLPKTGGRGLYPYTIGGAALMVASLTLLFYKRKRHRKEGIGSS